ncbi:unnamed protein product, partial [Ectocarpus sp. 4 AP-2014]
EEEALEASSAVMMSSGVSVGAADPPPAAEEAPYEKDAWGGAFAERATAMEFSRAMYALEPLDRFPDDAEVSGAGAADEDEG